MKIYKAYFWEHEHELILKLVESFTEEALNKLDIDRASYDLAKQALLDSEGEELPINDKPKTEPSK
jgi:hypothetical protein